MAFCPNCGSQIAEGAAFCPSCGKAVGQASGGAAAAPQPAPAAPSSYSAPAAPVQPTQAAAAPMEENVAGMLAYFTIIPAIIFLVVEPYNRNRFVRFHAFQCVFFHVAWIVLAIALGILSMVLNIIPVVGTLVSLILWPVVWLGITVLWVLLVIKAYQHQIYKLPVIGDMAEKQAGA